MNSILCPVDFSETSENALHYIAALASQVGSSVTLLHVLHVPAVDVYSPANVINDVMEVQQKTALLKLEALQEKMMESYPVNFSLKTEFGFAAEVISSTAGELGAMMIGMGTTGSGSGLNRFLGSVSYDTAKRSKLPVLVIPDGASFVAWDKVCIANDQQEPIGDALSMIHSLCKKCTPHIDLITVSTEDKADYQTEIVMNEGGVTTVLIKGHKIAGAISRYVEEHQVKLLGMKRHHRSFIENLLHKSTIKQVLGHSKIPALVF